MAAVKGAHVQMAAVKGAHVQMAAVKGAHVQSTSVALHRLRVAMGGGTERFRVFMPLTRNA